MFGFASGGGALRHTPGPWIKRTNPDDKGQLWIDSAEGSPITDLKDNGMQEGNADLIAAAPDMLEALVRIVQCNMWEVGDHIGTSTIADIERARKALAKAKGES